MQPVKCGESGKGSSNTCVPDIDILKGTIEYLSLVEITPQADSAGLVLNESHSWDSEREQLAETMLVHLLKRYL